MFSFDIIARQFSLLFEYFSWIPFFNNSRFNQKIFELTHHDYFLE